MEHNDVLLLEIIASFVLCISLLFNFVRVGIRSLSRRGWAPYDSVALIGVALSIVSFALQIFYAIHSAARTVNPKILIAQNVFAAATLSASKCTTNLITLKVHSHLAISRNHRIITYGKALVLVSIVWGLFSILLLSIYINETGAEAYLGCTESTSWRWLVFDLTGSAIELSMAVLVSLAFWPLKMTRLLKIKGFTVLESRILLVPLALARAGLLFSLSRSGRSDCAFVSSIMNQVIVHVSLITASINIITPTLNLYDLVPVAATDSQRYTAADQLKSGSGRVP